MSNETLGFYVSHRVLSYAQSCSVTPFWGIVPGSHPASIAKRWWWSGALHRGTWGETFL